MSFDRQLVDEVNELRRDPKKYTEKLNKYLSYFDGKILNLPGRKAGIQTHEGPKAYNEAINYLLRKNPVEPLQPSKALFRISQDYLKKIQRKNADVTEEDVDALVDKYGTYYGDFIRAADYGGENVEQSIINLIVSDGDPNRVQRESLLSSSYKLIGGATGTHPLFKFCTAIFTCTEFENKKDAEDIGYLDGGAPSNPQIKAQPQPSAQQKPITQSQVQSKVKNPLAAFGRQLVAKSLNEISKTKNQAQSGTNLEPKTETKYQRQYGKPPETKTQTTITTIKLQPKNETTETKTEIKYPRRYGKSPETKTQTIITTTKIQPQNETTETKTETKYPRRYGRAAEAKTQTTTTTKIQPQNETTETKTETKNPRRYGRPEKTKTETQITTNTTKYEPLSGKGETKYQRHYGRPAETKTETQTTTTTTKYQPKTEKPETKTETKYQRRYGRPTETKTETEQTEKTETKTETKYPRRYGRTVETKTETEQTEKTETKIETKYPRHYGRPVETKTETQTTTTTSKYHPQNETESKTETKYTRHLGRPETKTETQTTSKYDPKSRTKVETKTEIKYTGRYGRPIETTETQIITSTIPLSKSQKYIQTRSYGKNINDNSNNEPEKKVISEKTDEKISIQGGKKIREITITKIYADGTKDVETMVTDN